MKQHFDLRAAQEYLTPRQVAEKFGVTPEAIRSRVRQGRLGVRLHGRLMISREEAELMTVRRKNARS